MSMVTNVVSFLAAALLLMTVANATVHIVGDAAGWTSGINYEAWAAVNPIVLGDTLMFYYNPFLHDMRQVSEEDYKSCNTSNPIYLGTTGSDYFIPLTTGKTFVICGTPGHCKEGMKLEVKTLGYSGYVPSPPVTTYSGLPKRSAVHKFSSTGSFALTFAMMMLAAI